MCIPGQLVRWLLRRRGAPAIGVYAVVDAVALDAVTIRLTSGERHTTEAKKLFLLPEEQVKISQLFPSKYVKSIDIGKKTPTLTIDKLVIEQMGHGNEAENKPVLYFERATKGLVLNRTNAMVIAKLYGDESDEWKGKRITIYATTVRAFGKVHETIRVKEEIPATPKPVVEVAQAEESAILDDDEDVIDYGDGDHLFEIDEAAQ